MNLNFTDRIGRLYNQGFTYCILLMGLNGGLSIKEKICLTLIQEEKPMSTSDIAEELDMTRQRIHHHMGDLIEDSILLETNQGYVMQDPMYDSDLFDEFIEDLAPVFDRFARDGYVHKESDTNEMVKGNVNLFTTIIGHLTSEMEVEDDETCTKLQEKSIST